MRLSGVDFEPFVLTLYAITLGGMIYFALHRLKLLWMYLRHARMPARPAPWQGAPARVCVQCPLYNEPLVVERLLEAVARLRWEEGRLEIQILDDSTDETSRIIADWLAAHPREAARMRHVRRTNRAGYKAGALAQGMTLTSADFLAIFDADFRPAPDFLETTIPYFSDPKVGAVQARWEFSNRRASLLTRFQAIFLDAHFVVEQAARFGSGLFFNFNGTAGVWRRAALEDAGGWSADTVTEDLDMSYRAQRRGWKFVYLRDYVVESELPEKMSAFKTQQYRWTKGGMQVARKQLRAVLAGNLPGRVKIEAFLHLTTGLVYPLLLTFSFLFVPYLYCVADEQLRGVWLVINPLSVVLATGTTVVLYVTSQYFRERQWREGLLWLVAAPVLLAFGLAMCVTGCVAVIEGLVSMGGEFVRTPKGGRAAHVGGIMRRGRSRWLFRMVSVVEIVIGLGMLTGAVYFAQLGATQVAIMLGIKTLGFLGLAATSAPDVWPLRGT
ncbi:glycosyl transferase family 2 [Termitidicoccus mucosus]|uniref:Glycosyl transferase family 2 n=1 Tax=Termitidicoccus mucosus TaxID=1184151 RepID=A0A178IHY1_9BACT|nr:glycosyl transferase family 2 [Opitutaceae bacterium TSB47]